MGELDRPSSHPASENDKAEQEMKGDIDAGTERSSLEQPETTSTPPPAEQKETDVEAAPAPAPTGNAPGDANDMSSVPNGGTRAWLQVIGSFFLFFNSWGIVNTYGVYQTFYEVDFLKTTPSSTIAWIGSIQAFLLLVVGAASGPVYDAGYFRLLILVGSFLIVFGHMMLSLCTTFWQVLLSQAFCLGAGLGCLFTPSVAILSTYFNTKIATAVGLAASGSSLGGVLYPIILHKLIPQIGFPWSVRVIGFIAFATLVIPNLAMKVRVLPPARRKMIDVTAFRSAPFVLFCIGGFLAFQGLFIPFFYMQYYAITKHITSEDLAFYLLSILNAASVFGRIVPNIIADKLGPLNVVLPCAFLTGILVFCLIPVHNVGGMVVFALVFGFFSGSFVSLPPTIIVHLTPDRRFIGTRLGMYFSLVAVGTLIGTPIGGAILKASGFTALWIYGGTLVTAGGFFIFATRVAHKGWKPRIKA